MDQRPAILALHGAGTNSEIFSLQTQGIVKQLQDHFRFVFINAPFESRPGPGVAPTYLGMGPYFWWHCDESAATQFDITIKEVRRRRELVRNLFRSTFETEKVTGLMAFSQGARVATGLCLDPDLGRNIRLVITISATFPALGIHEDVASLLPQVLRVPSVHVQGTSDPWMSEGKRLRMQYFDCDQASV
ncbi:hypothetical protein Daus18300_012352 [Diaporthe australafricana]|uniref:Serine hydrolase domain-containing protein n=1 Tax=Diaporthe australafricana TaxID=127596 RepID=A0ABR3W3M0_9PEZI